MQYKNGSFKTERDTEGYQNDCSNYDPCPLCYGCRNYGIYSDRCDTLCGDNHKKNICNRELHTSRNIAKMVRRQIIKLEDMN